MRRGSKNDIDFEANSEEAGLQKGSGSLRAICITDSLRLRLYLGSYEDQAGHQVGKRMQETWRPRDLYTRVSSCLSES